MEAKEGEIKYLIYLNICSQLKKKMPQKATQSASTVEARSLLALMVKHAFVLSTGNMLVI